MSKVGPGGGGIGASEDPLLVFSASMETVPRAQEAGRNLVPSASSLFPEVDSRNPLTVTVQQLPV